MEKKELLEIEAREREQAEKNIKEMVQRKKMSEIWLLYKDKFDLGKQRVCYSAIPDVSPQLLIPISEKVLVPIPPLVSPEKFCDMMGFSVNQVVEWRKKGWVEAFMSMSYGRYKGLNYLDDLIEVSPSASVRTQEYMTMLVGSRDRFNRTFEEGEALLEGAIVPEEFQRLFGRAKAEEIYYWSSATSYVSLSVFGVIQHIKFDEIRKLTKGSPNVSANIINWLDTILVDPFVHGLRGTTVFPSELRDRASMLYEELKIAGEILFAPSWLADVYSNLGATVPQTMDTDEINAVRKHSEDFVCAVKGLDMEIDKTVKQRFRGGELDRGEKETIIAKREEFRKRWYEDVVPTFEDISRVKKVWSVALTGSIITSVVTLAALKDVLTVPSTMLSVLLNREKIMKLVDPAAEFLSTFFECNPIHLGFYKVHRELKKVK